jgi:glucokinase
MTVLLAGDIGGTKTILRLVETLTQNQYQILSSHRFASQDFTDLVPMVQQFLAMSAPTTSAPAAACFAIAGPVVERSAKLTNLSWPLLEESRLSEDLAIASVDLMNDFLAVGYGIPILQPADFCTLQNGEPQANGPIAVIGAGTGLGEAFLVSDGVLYHVYPSEGGHTDFAPRTELEFALSRYLLEKFGIDRVSTERVVSGQGIVAIYQFLRDRQVAEESPELAAIARTWEQEIGQTEKTVDLAAEVAKAALEERDSLCEQTLQIFVDAYGAEAGNLALKLLPTSGVYIAGGIAAKILPLLQKGNFLQNFRHKGRMSALLEKIPVHVVLNPEVGLLGAAAYAARRFY